MFQGHFSSSRATTLPYCFEIHALLNKLWSGQIRTDARMHANTLNKNCNNYVSLTRKRARQKLSLTYPIHSLLLEFWNCTQMWILKCLFSEKQLISLTKNACSVGTTATRHLAQQKEYSLVYLFFLCIPRIADLYSRTSMAPTPLGPWKLFPDRASLSQWGLIIAPGQEA